MSFVGTQLIDITHNDPRSMIKPGLIGLGHLYLSNIHPYDAHGHEQYYAMHYSLIYDIEIILKTILHI